MRILHVYKDYYPVPGGIENHVRTLAEWQVSSGHQVTVLVTNPGRLASRERLHGVQVLRARRLATVASTPLSLDLVLRLRAANVDITHLHFPYPVAETAQLMAGRGRPYVITYHSDVVRQRRVLALYRPLLMRILRNSRRIIATSDRYVHSSPFLSRLSGKTVVVPLSVNYEKFSSATELFGDFGRPVILFVGRHRHYKGVDDLLRAVKETEAMLLVAGDGPMRPAWEQLSSELDLQHRVKFLGYVPEAQLPGLYASADLFVLPANSRAEAFGKVLLEAMSAGLPCITTELGTGTSFVVQHEVTGLVVAPGDSRALAAALKRLLNDDVLRRKMGAAAKKRVAHEFSPQRMAQAVEMVYREVLHAEAPCTTNET